VVRTNGFMPDSNISHAPSCTDNCAHTRAHIQMHIPAHAPANRTHARKYTNKHPQITTQTTHYWCLKSFQSRTLLENEIALTSYMSYTNRTVGRYIDLRYCGTWWIQRAVVVDKNISGSSY